MDGKEGKGRKEGRKKGRRGSRVVCGVLFEGRAEVEHFIYTDP
jgi:hypothetical protein